MLKVIKAEAGLQNKKLNASVEDVEDLNVLLASVAEKLKTISADLAAQIEDQVMEPDVINATAKGTVADKLFDWTSDIFAISQDIEYYINPPTEE